MVSGGDLTEWGISHDLQLEGSTGMDRLLLSLPTANVSGRAATGDNVAAFRGSPECYQHNPVTGTCTGPE